jgi:hypothetical protein
MVAAYASTVYEPMKDASGQIIGIYCTAYLK